MKNIEILDKNFQRLCFMDNKLENGLHFSNDKLKTTVVNGLYTLDFTVYKSSPYHEHGKEGNYITFINRQGVRIFLTIMSVDESSNTTKSVYCEDTNLQLINKIVGPQGVVEGNGNDKKVKSQNLAYYVNEIIKDSGWAIGINESKGVEPLEYTSNESALQRIKKIAGRFDVEFYFSTNMEKSGEPMFYINFVKKRVEGEDGFRLSTDNLVEGVSRKVNIDNVATKIIVEGKPEEPVAVATANQNQVKTVAKSPTELQPTASKYDASKSTPGPFSFNGWSASWVDRFRIDAADPPHVTGEYIDNYLRTRYPNSPLIGQGKTIKEMADYYGIAVGFAMGVWAKETTYGIGHPGRVDHNYGCIRHTSEWPAVYYAGSAWNKYPNKKTGIAAWFKLVRWFYAETGQVTYSTFLNKYSPTFENNHSTFKNFMWAQLKSFGYDTSDTVRKKNYSKKSDDPRTVNPQFNVQVSATSTSTVSDHDKMINNMIKWFEDRKKGKPGAPRYSMSSARSGPNYYDCSSSVYAALIHAGFKPKGTWLGSTVTLWGEVGTLMKEIPVSQARRGDIFLGGPRGAASAGASGHTGVYVSNTRIIHMNYRDNGITETVASGRTGSPVAAFRLIPKASTSTSSGSDSGTTNGIPAKYEKAVQRALAQVGGRYVWGGTAFKANDCSGLIYESFRYAGFNINHRCTTASIQQQRSPFKKISKAEARRGDLAITMGGGHVEILLQPPSQGIRVVHASDPSRGIITQNSHAGRLVGYYRVMD